MGNDINERAVTGNKGRSGKSETAVLHTSVRERVWEDEEVVNPEAVSRCKVLSDSDLPVKSDKIKLYLLCSVLLKLPVCSLHCLGLGPHTSPPVTAFHVGECLVNDLARSDRDKIGWDSNRLAVSGASKSPTCL